MKLHIPSLNDRLRLTADWTFVLYADDRNSTMREIAFGKPEQTYEVVYAKIPAGEILKVDTMFARRHSDDKPRITFCWVGKSTPARVDTQTKWNGEVRVHNVRRRPVRFWVTLQDANNIEFVPA